MEGIARYIYETTKRMVLTHPQDEFHFFFDRPYDEAFIFAENVTGHVLSPQSRHPILWHLWFEYAVPSELKQINADLFLSGDMYLSLKTKVPTIMVSHDLGYEHYPEHLRWSHRKFMLSHSKKYHLKADHLIAVSDATKQDIVNTYDISPAKITVATNATPDGFAPISDEAKEIIRAKYTDGQPYFIYLGSLHPRKNIKNLLLAFDAYKQKHHSQHKLVLFGRLAFKNKEVFDTLDSLVSKAEVIFLNDSNHKASEMLAAAEALCYVSQFEGFGIPILEAFAAETAVITSNVSSMPEVAGDAAILVDPQRPSAIAQAMHRVASDANLRAELIAKGRVQKNSFSWALSAENIWREIARIVDDATI